MPRSSLIIPKLVLGAMSAQMAFDWLVINSNMRPALLQLIQNGADFATTSDAAENMFHAVAPGDYD